MSTVAPRFPLPFLLLAAGLGATVFTAPALATAPTPPAAAAAPADVAAPTAVAETATATVTVNAASTTTAALALAAAGGQVTVPYGTEGLITAFGGGTAKYTVSKPQAVTYHEVAFDTDSPTGMKAGAARKPVLRATLSVLGVSGEVSADIDAQLIYQSSDGTLVGTTVPIGTFEPTDWISMHPTTVGPGQRTAGEIYFETADAAGQVIARANGTQQVVWHP